MLQRPLLVVTLLLITSGALAYSFPALTGRVVDAAHILSPSTTASLEEALAIYQQQSTNQVVIATTPSLEGGSIEDYGYQLGRTWGIGQKGKDNGVILLVAPHERKVRIEVGYGLEGTLTDAQSHLIIENVILPDFRHGQMEQGVIDGTQAIVTALGGKIAIMPTRYAAAQMTNNAASNPMGLLIILAWIAFFLLRIFILPWWFPIFFPSSGLRGGFGGGGSLGGGFGGGGGNFGGGGASGGW